MGFNLYPLPLGTYTIIFEYYFPENTNIQLSCQSTTAYVHKQIQKDFTDYSKLLVQINNNSKTTPDYLFFTIHGTAVVSNPEGYIIVYGVKDWSDSVDSSVYDDAFYVQMFEYKNGDMQMQTDIDMNTHKIKNNPLPTNPTDLLTKESLITNDTNVSGNITIEKIFNISRFIFHIAGSRVDLINPFINFIILNVGPLFNNTQDQLSIAMSSSFSRFSFTTSASGYVKIIINRQFNGFTNKIFTNIISNARFVISYRPITFKTK